MLLLDGLDVFVGMNWSTGGLRSCSNLLPTFTHRPRTVNVQHEYQIFPDQRSESLLLHTLNVTWALARTQNSGSMINFWGVNQIYIHSKTSDFELTENQRKNNGFDSPLNQEYSH